MRAGFFLLKGKENFFAGLCSDEQAAGLASIFARARRNSPHTPLPPYHRVWCFKKKKAAAIDNNTRLFIINVG